MGIETKVCVYVKLFNSLKFAPLVHGIGSRNFFSNNHFSQVIGLTTADKELECLCLLSHTFSFVLTSLFLYGSFIVVNLFV